MRVCRPHRGSVPAGPGCRCKGAGLVDGFDEPAAAVVSQGGADIVDIGDALRLAGPVVTAVSYG